ncbi:MAG TPA: sulfurtransferase TusA family protein [Dissulfurispiraceae bacterium]|nr:sulfurtransferase TusA family protein [Dissulfurispiraceae bacterium]
MSLKAKTPAEVLDVMGRVCPYPLVLTKKQMEKLSSGQVLKVMCDAPASAEDSLPRFAEKSGFPIEVEKVGDHWEIYIEKK